MSYHYGVPPAHYQKFQDYSPQYSPAEYVHYVPASHDATPTKRHSRKHSHAESPRYGGYYSPAGSPPPYHEAYTYYTPRKEAHVSYETKASAYGKPPNYSRSTRKPSHPVYVYEDDGYVYAEPLPKYSQRAPATSKTKTSTKHAKKPSTDTYSYYHQGQVHEEQPKKSRARASTGSAKTTPKHRSTPSQSQPVSSATEKDAARAGIPSGYSIKNWDPTEKPIILLGSVFDANSLGKWIYDWTVFHHGAASPMADMAGDLWLLLIKLAGKTKRAEECVRRVRNEDSRDMIEDFLASGTRLWEKFKQLLKDCEYYMMKAAKKDGSKTMGKNAGTEFVDSIFGRERYLEQTEKIMANIRLWNMRFDVNCEDILRRPSAA